MWKELSTILLHETVGGEELYTDNAILTDIFLFCCRGKLSTNHIRASYRFVGVNNNTASQNCSRTSSYINEKDIFTGIFLFLYWAFHNVFPSEITLCGRNYQYCFTELLEVRSCNDSDIFCSWHFPLFL